jgi:2-iminobutanoate/2-iminopropanoate deaminase
MTQPTAPEQPVDDSRAWRPVERRDCPPPKGAYSPGVRAGDLLFVSGQVPRDPKTGELTADDVTGQSRQVLRNLEGVLAAAGATLADVVAVTVYLTNVDDWGAFDATYREVFQPPFPTRTVVGASLRGILVEISAVAYVGGRT